MNAILDFYYATNPISIEPNESFQIYISDVNGFDVCRITSNIRYIANFGTIRSFSMRADNFEIASNTNVQISFLPFHPLIQNIELRVVFPNDFSISASTCQLSNLTIIASTATCSFVNLTVVIAKPFNSSYSPTLNGTISFKVNGIQMPSSSSQTGTFNAETYAISSADNQRYMVDSNSV